MPVLLLIRVKPGSSRTQVGGSYAGRLTVSVQERAVDGKATEACSKALAKALGIKAHELSLVRGATSRDKDFSFESSDSDRIVQIQGRFSELLAQ